MKKFFIDNLLEHHNDILFDLDDTLYDESLYLFEAYKQIGIYLAKYNNGDGETIVSYLIENFIKRGRKDLFNSCINHFSLPSELIDEMLVRLRNVVFEKPLELRKFVPSLFSTLLDSYKRIFVITNGNVRQQQHKVNSIDWRGLNESIKFIYANAFEPKPSRYIYDELQKRYQLDTPIYIGDSEVDKQFAENCGIPFWYINDVI